MKTKNKSKLVFLCVATLMLTACEQSRNSSQSAMPTASGAEASASAPAPVVGPTVFEGEWKSSCQKIPDIDSHHYRRVYDFSNNEMKTSIIYYDDALTKDVNRCSDKGKLLKASFVSSFTIGTVIDPGQEDEHTNIDITDSKLKVTPLNEAAVDILNNNTDPVLGIYKGFGITTWKLNVTHDLSGNLAARKTFNIGTMAPDIYKISVDAITEIRSFRFGDKQGNIDADGRPINISTGDTSARFVSQ